LVADLLREKSTAGWWLISQTNRLTAEEAAPHCRDDLPHRRIEDPLAATSAHHEEAAPRRLRLDPPRGDRVDRSGEEERGGAVVVEEPMREQRRTTVESGVERRGGRAGRSRGEEMRLTCDVSVGDIIITKQGKVLCTRGKAEIASPNCNVLLGSALNIGVVIVV
jgi:hypothetical protein